MSAPDADRPEAAPTPDDPLRPVLRRALRDMLVLVVAVGVVGTVVGLVIAGSSGLWGALIGVAVTLVFSGTTVVSVLRTTRSSATTTAGVVLGAWLGKMLLLMVVLAVLADRDFYDRRVLVGVLVVGALGSALLDYRAVAKGRVPYSAPGT
ncbi:hypothetical protein Q6348_13830 [Isoptericola sp. b441]|uniref:ATP synthase protein I n=1 Tax=Actinotalea lenta TaxID=3064654 RepID=A0ABT9DCP9_9CELL|nr:hypothetical protein [Isoptericola sp. b441]MDO8108276.1 hypothetical protein [Isoptericola sp. b441]